MRAFSSPAVAVDGADVIIPTENAALAGGTDTSALPLTTICGAAGLWGICWATAVYPAKTHTRNARAALTLVARLSARIIIPHF
jgi:hypothetical protein